MNLLSAFEVQKTVEILQLQTSSSSSVVAQRLIPSFWWDSLLLCVLVVFFGYGMCRAGLLVTLHTPCIPMIVGLSSPTTAAVRSSFTGDEAPYAVSSIPVVRPKMLGNMAGLDDKASYAVLPCRGAEAVSHGVQRTMETPSCPCTRWCISLSCR